MKAGFYLVGTIFILLKQTFPRNSRIIWNSALKIIWLRYFFLLLHTFLRFHLLWGNYTQLGQSWWLWHENIPNIYISSWGCTQRPWKKRPCRVHMCTTEITSKGHREVAQKSECREAIKTCEQCNNSNIFCMFSCVFFWKEFKGKQGIITPSIQSWVTEAQKQVPGEKSDQRWWVSNQLTSVNCTLVACLPSHLSVTTIILHTFSISSFIL